MHNSTFFKIPNRSCGLTIPKHSELLAIKPHIRVIAVAVAPGLYRASLHGVTEFLHHGTTTELKRLSKLMNEP